jgi:DNA repair protein RecO (recombination protein O)
MDRLDGLVLKQIAYKESSKILHVTTSEGRKSVLVHGAKKLNSPYLAATEPMTQIRFIVSGTNLQTLRDTEIVHDFRVLKADVVKYAAGCHVMELVDRLDESEIDHAKLYPFMLKILHRVETEPDYELFVAIFELKLLYLIGVQPNLRQCAVCSSTNDLKLAVEGGGCLCPEHRDGEHTWDNETLDAVRNLYYHDLQNPLDWTANDTIRRSLRRFIDHYYSFHLNLHTKSRQLWMGLLGY